MAELNEFVKEINDVAAPAGFHYMPNGKLMSDADHIAIYGYVEKKLSGIDINLKDISFGGESRPFTIQGKEAYFSLEIKDNDNNYYDFYQRTWGLRKTGLKRIKIEGVYRGSIIFPTLEFTDTTCDYNNDPTIAHDDDDGKIKAGMTVTGLGIPDGATVATRTSDTAFELSASTTGGAVTNATLVFGGLLKTYTLELTAETVNNIKSVHQVYFEARNSDGSININASSGSTSTIIRKVMYQDVAKNLYLSCIAPSKYASITDTINGATSSSNRVVMDNKLFSKGAANGDLITSSESAIAAWQLVKEVNPDGDNEKELEIQTAQSFSDGVTLTFLPSFNGTTPHSSDSTSGRAVIPISSGGSARANFSITITAPSGRTFSVQRTPNIKDLCTFKNVEFESAALAIPGENTSEDALFHRWPVTNIAGLAEGMMLDPARSGGGTNVLSGSSIAAYTEIETFDGVRKSSSGNQDIIYKKQIIKTKVPGVDAYGNDITAVDRNGIKTVQKGNLVFNRQQVDALKSDSSVRIFGHGKKHISTLTDGMKVSLSNVEITPTELTITTSASSSSSTTIAVASTAGGVANLSIGSELFGININSAVANPTVVSKAAQEGAANIVVSSAQTLESGQILFVKNTAKVLTLTGTIEVSNFPLADTTLYFDLESFIQST